MKKQKHFFKRTFYVKSPFEQYNDEVNTEKETREKSEYEGSIIVFDDMLDSNQKTLDPFLQEGDIETEMFNFYQNLILIH